jgi:hypothetical protein
MCCCSGDKVDADRKALLTGLFRRSFGRPNRLSSFDNRGTARDENAEKLQSAEGGRKLADNRNKPRLQTARVDEFGVVRTKASIENRTRM